MQRDRWALLPATHPERRALVAAWICRKYRLIALEDGMPTAARRLRKSEGVPLEIALRILGITPTHRVQAPAEPTGTTAGRARSFQRRSPLPGGGGPGRL